MPPAQSDVLPQESAGQFAQRWLKRIRDYRAVLSWQMTGQPAPPPHAVKVKTVLTYAERFRASILVETGTFQAAMVLAVKDRFAQIHSIELDAALHNAAIRRTKIYPHILLWHGDSREVLPSILAQLHGVCLFWLDAHYSGGPTTRAEVETPIEEELHRVLASERIEPVVLIDDARLFRGAADYPTIEELNNIVRNIRPDWTLMVKHDIIRIHRRVQ